LYKKVKASEKSQEPDKEMTLVPSKWAPRGWKYVEKDSLEKRQEVQNLSPVMKQRYK